MNFNKTPLEGSYLIEPVPFKDERGWFARTYSKDEFEKIGHTKEWVQLNHSVTFKKGTIRGMHFQFPPHSEIKMVRCVAGSIFDVIIDVRQNSPTFLQWYGAELSADNKQMLYIPEGFAHGFQALTDGVELIYHHSEFYTRGSEGGIRYNDPRVNISWPLPVTAISERDESHPLLDNTFNGIKL